VTSIENAIADGCTDTSLRKSPERLRCDRRWLGQCDHITSSPRLFRTESSTHKSRLPFSFAPSLISHVHVSVRVSSLGFTAFVSSTSVEGLPGQPQAVRRYKGYHDHTGYSQAETGGEKIEAVSFLYRDQSSTACRPSASRASRCAQVPPERAMSRLRRDQ
jgi:hypothetical protein